ncbi:MAG: hypothetical protein IID00_03565 [Chloroflexi bacterium]|nr:hypothetical protein [Chloroflexota bacterium]
MSAWTQPPRVDVDGCRRPLELTNSLRQDLANYLPAPSFRLVRGDMIVFHLVWPPGRALCDVAATRAPLAAPSSPFLCGDCAWKFETAAGRELVE